MLRRWKEHLCSSMRKNHAERTSKFYSAYIYIDFMPTDLPIDEKPMSNFQQLEKFIGIGIKKNHVPPLFNHVHGQSLN